MLAEHLQDGRSAQAPPTIHADDVFVGVRMTLNAPRSALLINGLRLGSRITILDTAPTEAGVRTTRRHTPATPLKRGDVARQATYATLSTRLSFATTKGSTTDPTQSGTGTG